MIPTCARLLPVKPSTSKVNIQYVNGSPLPAMQTARQCTMECCDRGPQDLTWGGFRRLSSTHLLAVALYVICYRGLLIPPPKLSPLLPVLPRLSSLLTPPRLDLPQLSLRPLQSLLRRLANHSYEELRTLKLLRQLVLRPFIRIFRPQPSYLLYVLLSKMVFLLGTLPY